MNAPMLSIDEVAARLSLSRATVYRLCKAQNGIRSYKVAKCIRVKPEDVDEYLERQLVQPPQRQEGPRILRFQYKPGMRVVSL